MNKLSRFRQFMATSTLCGLIGIASPLQAADVSIAPGWNLRGFNNGTPMNVEAIFGKWDANIPNVTSNVVTVWKWVDGGWEFWTPTMSAVDLATYATGKGYKVLSTIQPGEGYWINARAAIQLNDFAAIPSKLGSFDTIRKVDNNCHEYTFNPRNASLAIAISGSAITLTEDDFFDNRCVYSTTSIESPLSGTFRCANNAFDVGTFTLIGDGQNEANDIRIVMDVVTTNRLCNYKIKFVGFRQ